MLLDQREARAIDGDALADLERGVETGGKLQLAGITLEGNPLQPSDLLNQTREHC